MTREWSARVSPPRRATTASRYVLCVAGECSVVSPENQVGGGGSANRLTVAGGGSTIGVCPIECASNTFAGLSKTSIPGVQRRPFWQVKNAPVGVPCVWHACVGVGVPKNYAPRVACAGVREEAGVVGVVYALWQARAAAVRCLTRTAKTGSNAGRSPRRMAVCVMFGVSVRLHAVACATCVL